MKDFMSEWSGRRAVEDYEWKWLKCEGGKNDRCFMRSCPSEDVDFGFGGDSCTGVKFKIYNDRGTDIRNRDAIGLQNTKSKLWLSHTKSDEVVKSHEFHPFVLKCVLLV